MTDWSRPTFAVKPTTTALLLIDLQNDFLADGAPYESVDGRGMIDSLNQLAVTCRAAGIPVVYTAQGHRADGSDLGAVRNLHPLTADGRALRDGTKGVELYTTVDIKEGDYLLRKRRYSAFFGTDLELLLRNLHVSTLIIGGVSTNVCCESTARDAFFRDFEVIFLEDGTATVPLPDAGWGSFTAEELQRNSLTNVATFYGEVASVADITRRIRQLIS